MKLSGQRRAIESVIGALFFILIMIISLGALIVIFNSFNSYSTTTNKVANTRAQVAATQLTVSSASFGAFPPSTTSNFNVATVSCTTTSTSPTNQEGLFFAASMWWDFFTCGSSFQYSTSYDGIHWEAQTSIPSLVSGYTAGPYFDSDVVGSTVYLAIADYHLSAFQLAIGTLASGGTYASPAGTITWTSVPAQVTTTAAASGPIQVEADTAGNVWVTVVQGNPASAIAVYERQVCPSGISSNAGWEPNSCSSSAAPTNYAPTSSPNLGSLSANANMITFAPPSTLSSTGIIILYETGSSTAPSTGTLGIITANTSPPTTWITTITLSGLSTYALSSSSAVFVGNTMYFAGLASASAGAFTCASACTLKFWTLPFTSISAGTNTAEQQIEGSSQSWQAALTSVGTTLALFDAYPTGTTIQYYTSSTLGSIWNSPAIVLDSGETAINSITPASGGFGVTWANAAPYVRFAALSAVSVTNSSPFGVHIVDLYISKPATNSLVAHYYLNSTETFDYWVGQGTTMSLPVRFVWAASTSYLVTVATDTGVTAQLSATSPAVSSTTCPSGMFLSGVAPALTCVSLTPATPPYAYFTAPAATCTDTTSGTAMNMGFAATYTTRASSTGTIRVSLSFDLKSPVIAATDTSTWQLVYGTGTAPGCNAASPSGTSVGNSYVMQPESSTPASESSQTVTVIITGLSPSTAYWFDVQATDNSGDGWIYSNPALSVTDLLYSSKTANTAFSTEGNAACSVASTSTFAGGFGLTYTTGASGSYSGNIYLSLSFQVVSPSTASALTSKWTVTYGTGTPPACGATTGLGTATGKQYTIETQVAATLQVEQSAGIVITGLTSGTTYWFDVQVVGSSSTASWTYKNAQIAVVEEPALPNVPSNDYFTFDANSCGTSSTTGVMGLGPSSGTLGLYYQTSSSTSGSIYGTLTFNYASGASGQLGTWQLAYGTGAAPICGATATGTLVGQAYHFDSEAGVVGGNGETVSFVLSSLSPDTVYWFDIKMISSTGTVTASNPQLSVSEVVPSGQSHDNTHFLSSALSCGVASTSAEQGGLATTATGGTLPMMFQTTSWGSGNVLVTLNFKIATPAASPYNTQYKISYGVLSSGTAGMAAGPACDGGTSGTAVGNLEEVGTVSTTAGFASQSISVSLPGLSHATMYWIDLQVTDSSTTYTWTFSNPQISVLEAA